MSMLLVIAILIAGAVFLVIGVRGKRIDDHPICARCKFDLHGLSDPSCCPECGGALNASGAIRIGHRQRSPIMIALGGTLSGFILALLGLTIWSAIEGTNVDAYKPAWMLKLQVKHGIFGSRDAAVLELVNRVSAQTLPNATIAWILVDGLGMRVKTRDQIQSGDPWPYAIDFRVKNNITGVSLFFNTDQIDVGPYFKPPQTGHVGIGGIGGHFLSSAHVGPIETGSYDAKLRFWFALAPGPRTMPPPISKVVLTFPRKLEVLPHHTAKSIRNESIRPAILKAIQLSPTYANQFSKHRLMFWIDVHDPPTNVAFEVFVKQGDAERRIGSLMGRKNERMTYGFSHDLPKDFAPDPETMLIVLRPNAKAAEATVDITEFWGGEIVLPVKDVKPNVPR